MALYIHPDVHDNGLTELKNNAERVVLVSAATSSYASVAANALADAALAPADLTIADGDVDGRKITMAGKSPIVDTQGDPVEALIVDDVNSRILLRTDETGAQILYVGNVVNIPSITYTSRDPA